MIRPPESRNVCGGLVIYHNNHVNGRGYSDVIHSIQEIYQLIKEMPAKKVAVAQAADSHVLQAVAEAYNEGYIDAVLIGNTEKIKEIAVENDIDLRPFELLEAPDDEGAAKMAVKMVHDHRADVVMKGLMESGTFLRAVLNKEYGLRKEGNVISAIAVVELLQLQRLTFLTDLGITPLPDLDTKVKLLNNAAEVAHKFGIEVPKVAALSAAETLNPSMASSYEGAELEKMCKEGRISGCEVAGPISFDLAMSEEAAKEKGYDNPIAGKADVLLVPSIEVGNVLYKALMLFADMRTGGIIAGTSAPVVFCSRADSASTKKNTLAMAVYLAGKQ